jgi:hypothetical protein
MKEGIWIVHNAWGTSGGLADVLMKSRDVGAETLRSVALALRINQRHLHLQRLVIVLLCECLFSFMCRYALKYAPIEQSERAVILVPI